MLLWMEDFHHHRDFWFRALCKESIRTSAAHPHFTSNPIYSTLEQSNSQQPKTKQNKYQFPSPCPGHGPSGWLDMLPGLSWVAGVWIWLILDPVDRLGWGLNPGMDDQQSPWGLSQRSEVRQQARWQQPITTVPLCHWLLRCQFMVKSK